MSSAIGYAIGKLKLINKLKPVYVEPYNKVLQVTILSTDIGVKLDSKHYEYLDKLVLFTNLESRREDSVLLYKVAKRLIDVNKRNEMLDYLEYLRDRWLDGLKIDRSDFLNLSKLIIERIFSTDANLDYVVEARKYFFNLSKDRKCEMLKGLIALLIFNRRIVLDY